MLLPRPRLACLSAVLPAVLLLLSLLLGGCAAHVHQAYLSATPITTEKLLDGEPLFGAEAASMQPVEEDILALDRSMEDFLAFALPSNGSGMYQARELASALVDPGLLGFDFLETANGNARDTFHRAQGNCLAFTNLYVALARRAGFKISYQLSYIEPNWETEGSYFILRRHVNSLVKLAARQSLTVDLDSTRTGNLYAQRLIPDRHAFALFYSNIGVANLQSGDYRQAFRYLRQAVLTDPDVGSTWVNLGALYSREGLAAFAEAAYLESARRDPGELLAYSNLGRLYQTAGLLEQAQEVGNKARQLRQSNPYYHFQLAQQASRQGLFRESNEHLRRAMQLKKDEPVFEQLLQDNNRKLSIDSSKPAAALQSG